MRTYRKIAEIYIKHNYYTKGIVDASDFAFFKIPATEKLMANYRLMLKFKPGRIEIIQECEQEDGVTKPFIEIDQELKFSIVLQLKNKQFFAFTELPFLQMNKEVFYFSNRQDNKTKHEGQLNLQNFTGEEDIQLLFPKSSVQLTNLSWQKTKTIENIDKSTTEEVHSPEHLSEILIKLSVGYYEIKTDNKTEISFVLIKNKFSTADIGLIEFFITPEMAKKVSEPLQFSIDFDARKLKWQYQVFERFNSIKNIVIVDDKSKIDFEEQGQVELNGMQSKLFVSKQAIPIREITKQAFRVMSPSNGRAGKVWIEKLPVPKLSNLSKLSATDNNLVFKEYVYL